MNSAANLLLKSCHPQSVTSPSWESQSIFKWLTDSGDLNELPSWLGWGEVVSAVYADSGLGTGEIRPKSVQI